MQITVPKPRKKLTVAFVAMAAQTALFLTGQLTAEQFATMLAGVSGLFSIGQGIADKGKEEGPK